MNDLTSFPESSSDPAKISAPAAAMAAELPQIASTQPVVTPERPLAQVEPNQQPSAAPAGASDTAVSGPAIGVLLVNLGTPDAPEPKAVRRYLKQFLTDKRVIEGNSTVFKIVLYGVILPLRSRRKAKDYRSIWNSEKDESPLKTITRAQAEKLAERLAPLGRNIIVDWAMRYANPSIASRLEALTAQGCERILVMPLYPQYSAATTATVNDEVFRYVMGLRAQPALRFLPPYYAAAAYIDALAASLKAALQALPFEPDIIMASFHGMPRDYVDNGDPYEQHCARTTELLRHRLGVDDQKLILTYQSRFGRARWLEPYTIKTVKALAKKGIKNLAVVTPGFSADCLETLEEIAVENGRVFKRNGGENFAAIPCLNDSADGMQMLFDLAQRELKGWV
jgi:ferrochelatase